MTDHFSGPRAVADPPIDFTDLFVFPSPSQPGRLVLAMDVFPAAGPGAFFSDAASYRFRARPVTIASSGPSPRFAVGSQEYAITCTFAAPAEPVGLGQAVQEGSCMLPNGTVASFRVNDEQGGHADGVRVFAGLRLDPFFEAAPKEAGTRASRRIAVAALADPRDQQYLNEYGDDGFFILSIVVELDLALVLASAPGTLLAVAAETITTGKLSTRLERYGRPLVKNVLLSRNGPDTVNRGFELRALYDQEDPFQLAPDYLDAHRARLNANLAFLDRLDEKIDWPLQTDGTHPLTELFLADFQVIDVAKPFAQDSYLEIERALLQGRAHATCGGRWLSNDAFDTLYTFTVSPGTEAGGGSGADKATVRSSQSFPYLAPPDPTPSEREVPTPSAH